jgi:hypothetical protein
MIRLASPDEPPPIDINQSGEALEAMVKEEPLPAPQVVSVDPCGPGPRRMARAYIDGEHKVKSPRTRAMITPSHAERMQTRLLAARRALAYPLDQLHVQI